MKDSTAESLSRLPSRRVLGYDRIDSTDTKAEDTILNDVRRIVISHVGWDIWNNEVSTLK